MKTEQSVLQSKVSTGGTCLMLALLAATLTACGGGGGGSSNTSQPPVQQPPPPPLAAVANTPQIIGYPESVTVGVGTRVEWSIEARANGAVSYAWRFNGVPIDGATYPVFSLYTGATLADAGQYDCVVTNTLNGTTATATTSAATLTVIGEPGAVTLTGEDAVLPNSSGHIVSTTGQAGETYEWTITNGTITAGQGEPQMTYTAGRSGKTTVVLTLANLGGKSIGVKDVVVTPSLPIAPVFAQPTVHPGSNGVVASAPLIGGQTYTWSAQSNTASATIVGSAASNVLSYNVGSSPGTYDLTLTAVDQAGRNTSVTRSLAVSDNMFLLDARDPMPRSLHTATTLNDGTVLIVGGDAGVPETIGPVRKPGNQSRLLGSTELFDPQTRTFARLTDPVTPRLGHTATLLEDGRVLAAGGAVSAFAVSTVVDTFDPATRSWNSSAPLNQARAFHSATLLADGRVLVLGGVDANAEALATAEIYNPENNAWTTAPSMSIGRVQHSATRMRDGRVLVVGGPSAEIYDPVSNAWTATPEPPSGSTGAVLLANGDVLVLASRSFLYKPATNTWELTSLDPYDTRPGAVATTALLLPDGRVLAAGALNVSSTHEGSLYDPIKSRWQRLTLRYASMSAVTALRDGTMFEVGGIQSSSGFAAPEYFQSAGRAIVFDPKPATTTTLGSGAHAGYDAATALLSDGRLLATGGEVSRGAPTSRATTNSDIYDSSSNQWTATSPMVTARTAHTASTLPGNQILVVGGENGFAGVFASAERYDAATNSWTPAGFMSVQRYKHTATTLADGRVVVAGGSDRNTTCSCTTFQSSVDIYNPVTNSWAAAASLQTARFNHTATRLVDGRILVVGGFGGTPDTLNDGGSVLASAEIYDPSAGTWTPAAAMSTPRTEHTATSLSDGRVLIAGGTSGAGALTSAEIYDPANNTWSAAASMSFARLRHKAASLPGARILIAGGFNGSTSALFGVENGEIYDEVTNTWTTVPRVVPRQRFTLDLLPNGRVLLLGGTPIATGLPEFFQ